MKYFTVILLLLFSLLSCKDTPDAEDLLQHMVVQTRQDENTAFYFYNSFTLTLDTLGYYSNVFDSMVMDGRGHYVYDVTRKIKSMMEAGGYIYLNKNQDPDLGFAATIFYNYEVYQSISEPIYYTGYQGYGYGGYYGFLESTYQYGSSSLVIYLLDLKTPYQEGHKVIWKAYIGDLFQSVDPDQEVLEAIEQAFKQSPYLSKS